MAKYSREGQVAGKTEGHSAALGPVPPRIVAIEWVASTLVLGLWNACEDERVFPKTTVEMWSSTIAVHHTSSRTEIY